MKRFMMVVLFASAVAGLVMAQDFPAMAVVSSDGVRVRSAPDLGSKTITTLKHGSLVGVSMKSGSSMTLPDSHEPFWWYQIDLDSGSSGWVYGSFLFFDESNSDEARSLLPENTDVTIGAGSAGRHFSLSLFSNFPDQGDDAPQYTVLSLIALLDDQDHVAFVKGEAKTLQAAGIATTPDGYVVLGSDMDGHQYVKNISPAGKLARIMVYEATNGGNLYQILLSCSYNANTGLFSVEGVSRKEISPQQ